LLTIPQVFGPPQKDHATSNLPQHGFARTSRWEYLGKTSSESSTLPNNSGDSSVKLDFGLSDSMIGDAKWPYHFALTYSVTLSPKDLETTLVVRNTGTSNYDFQTLFHTYLKVDVSSCIIQNPFTALQFRNFFAWLLLYRFIV